MSLCPSSLSFSEVHSAKRVEAASKTLGETVVRRLVAFALFLMGAKREEIAQHLSMPLLLVDPHYPTRPSGDRGPPAQPFGVPAFGAAGDTDA